MFCGFAVIQGRNDVNFSLKSRDLTPKYESNLFILLDFAPGDLNNMKFWFNIVLLLLFVVTVNCQGYDFVDFDLLKPVGTNRPTTGFPLPTFTVSPCTGSTTPVPFTLPTLQNSFIRRATVPPASSTVTKVPLTVRGHQSYEFVTTITSLTKDSVTVRPPSTRTTSTVRDQTRVTPSLTRKPLKSPAVTLNPLHQVVYFTVNTE